MVGYCSIMLNQGPKKNTMMRKQLHFMKTNMPTSYT